MRRSDNTTYIKAALAALLAMLTVCTASCAKKADDKSAEEPNESVESAEGIVYDENVSTIRIDEVAPISEEEAAAVEEYLHSELGGSNPIEEQFDFSFPVKGTIDMNGETFYIGAWEMRLYNEMGEVSSSQVIMDFMLPTDYSAMYEIYGEDGEYSVFMRDVLHQS